MGTHVREQETLVSTPLPTSGRRALGGGGLAALAAPAFAHSAPDPVFAAIAEHARLWQSVEAACRLEKGVEEASDQEGKALHRLLATVPTTPAGLLAYLDHLASPMGFGEEGPSDQEFPAILATVRAFAEVVHA